MNLENQVCSLEYAKRLKELGVKQESIFCWLQGINTEEYFIYPSTPCFPDINWREKNKIPDYGCSAFTVAELMELLPHRVTVKDNKPYNSFRFNFDKRVFAPHRISNYDNSDILHCLVEMKDMYVVNYLCDTTSSEMNWMFSLLTKNMTDENPANALAKMLIYLLENGLIKSNDT